MTALVGSLLLIACWWLFVAGLAVWL